MEWGIYLVGAVLSAALGYVGGQLALLRDRRRQDAVPTAPTAGSASFRLEHLDGQTWSLVNTGDAPAALVRLAPLVDGLERWPPTATAGEVATAMSELLPTLAPGDAMAVWFSRHDPGQRAIVSWTAANDVRMGPVVLTVPPPR